MLSRWIGVRTAEGMKNTYEISLTSTWLGDAETHAEVKIRFQSAPTPELHRAIGSAVSLLGDEARREVIYNGHEDVGEIIGEPETILPVLNTVEDALRRPDHYLAFREIREAFWDWQ